MSQTFEAFRQTLETNPALQKEVADIILKAKTFDSPEISEFCVRHNLDITPKDAFDYYKTMDESVELTDFELEMVSAGSGSKAGCLSKGDFAV